MKEAYTCQYCNRAVSFVSAHGGFSDVLSFYCSKCPNVLGASLYDEFVSYASTKKANGETKRPSINFMNISRKP